ncbi:MAG: ATP synthase subunit I [Pseudomonadota bacterium]
MAAENEQKIEGNPLISTSKVAVQDMVAWSYLKVILLQVLLTICFVAGLLFSMGKLAAISALIGGGIAVGGSLIYARFALIANGTPGSLLRAHFCAEIAKVFATVSMFAAVMIFMQWVAVPWVFTAFLVASAGYWFSLLVIK